MKVYLLESGSCRDGDHRIHGVFTSLENAKIAAIIMKVPAEITEVVTDEFVVYSTRLRSALRKRIQENGPIIDIPIG